jgi:hypothetical protein
LLHVFCSVTRVCAVCPVDLCFHANIFRAVNPASTDPRRVPNMIIHAWFKQYEEPTEAEGFGGGVHHVPQYATLAFASDAEKALFHSYLDA